MDPNAVLDTRWTRGEFEVGWFALQDAFVVYGGRPGSGHTTGTRGIVWNGTFFVPELCCGRFFRTGNLRWLGVVDRAAFLRERPFDGWWHGIAHPFVDNLPQLLRLPKSERAGTAVLVSWCLVPQVWDLIASLFPEMRAIDLPRGSLLLARRLFTQDRWIHNRVFFDLLCQMRSILLETWGIRESPAAGRGCVLNRAPSTPQRRITNLRDVAQRLAIAAPHLEWSYYEALTGYYSAAQLLVDARAYVTPHGAAGVFCAFLRPGSVFATVLFRPPIQWSTLAAAFNLLFVHCRRDDYHHRTGRPLTLSEEMIRNYVAVVGCAIRSGSAMECGGVVATASQQTC